MRAVVSRVVWARVVADGELTGEIGPGLLVLVGVTHGDTEADAAWLAAKVAALRVFDDDQGRMNRSLADTGGGALVEAVAKAIAGAGVPVATGRFGAAMRVESAGDGPVTILLDTAGRS